MSKTISIKLWDDESGDMVVEQLPAHYEVCRKCEGEGKHMTDSMREHAYSQEEFYEEFPTAEERERYFGGFYDVTCTLCKGKRVTLELDREAIEFSGDEELKGILKRYDDQLEEDRQYEMMRAAERAYGC